MDHSEAQKRAEMCQKNTERGSVQSQFNRAEMPSRSHSAPRGGYLVQTPKGVANNSIKDKYTQFPPSGKTGELRGSSRGEGARLGKPTRVKITNRREEQPCDQPRDITWTSDNIRVAQKETTSSSDRERPRTGKLLKLSGHSPWSNRQQLPTCAKCLEPMS